MILDTLAKMMEFDSISQVLEIFAEKIINNLTHSHLYRDEEEQNIVVSHSLDSLNRLINTVSSCRLIAQTPLMKSLISQSALNLQILQGPRQSKQLGHFFKILGTLWLDDDNAAIFEENISQLDPLFESILGMSEARMCTDLTEQCNVVKCFYILRGLFGGAVSHRSFGILFEWFYP